MANKSEEMQRIIRLYKEETGEKGIDMSSVAKFAIRKGWPMPKPKSPLELLSKQFSQAAREETRRDSKTGRAYRANHALQIPQGGSQLTLWIDIDEAPRHHILKSLMNRREQMVGDGLQLTLDADHWNSVHSDDAPIIIPLDFTDDVEWRKNAPDENDQSALPIAA